MKMIIDDYTNHAYMNMVEDWKVNQKRRGRNMRPGQGTRRRIMNNSEMVTDGLYTVYNQVYRNLLNNWIKNQKREKQNPIPGEGTRNRFRREAFKVVFV